MAWRWSPSNQVIYLSGNGLAAYSKILHTSEVLKSTLGRAGEGRRDKTPAAPCQNCSGQRWVSCWVIVWMLVVGGRCHPGRSWAPLTTLLSPALIGTPTSPSSHQGDEA